MDLQSVSDWRVGLGSHLPTKTLWIICAAAVLAVLLSAVSLWWERRRGRALGLLLLRTIGVGVCVFVALQPSLEMGNVTRVPNHVAVLVDTSASMGVRPSDGGPSRAARAAAALTAARPVFADWEQQGHRVDLFSFSEALTPAGASAFAAESQGEATRIGEAPSELRSRYAGKDLGAVIIVSDGVDTGRIGRGPLDGETRAAVTALGAPLHTVLIGESGLKDLSVFSVLADDFAFVRTPIKLEAVIRSSGFSDRAIEVTLTRDGRLVEARSAHVKGQDFSPGSSSS
jgi:uncharacterized membrane protein